MIRHFCDRCGAECGPGEGTRRWENLVGDLGLEVVPLIAGAPREGASVCGRCLIGALVEVAQREPGSPLADAVSRSVEADRLAAGARAREEQAAQREAQAAQREAQAAQHEALAKDHERAAEAMVGPLRGEIEVLKARVRAAEARAADAGRRAMAEARQLEEDARAIPEYLESVMGREGRRKAAVK